MKFGGYFMLWLLVALTLAAAEQARTWTDTQGRTLTGIFVEANKQEVTVRLDNGGVVHLPRTSLSADDLAYADKAEANRPIATIVEVSRVTFSTNTSVAKGIQTVADKIGYNITVTNQSLFNGQAMRVDYRIYWRQGAQGKSIASQPLSKQSGSESFPKLESRGNNSFRTSMVTINRKSPAPGNNGKSNNSWPNGSTETVADEIEGIWVKVFQGEQQVGEYLSGESLRTDGWSNTPAAAPAKAGKKKAPAASAAN